ncbi:FAD-binding oxidoreductase [Pseudonocardia sp.]|uniref:FAD-binding oxidoreductase n=1 Tax=Pseudonocardia sp. TaxID=60912 RepID=UPI003D0CE6B3
MSVPTVDLTGDVLRPGDPTYDDARAVFNAMIDRRPSAILRCHDTDDVARGIAFARAHDLALAVRGGGHNVAGNAMCDGGIVLDLSPMRELTVDPAERTAWAGPGLLLGDLDAATAAHGLATPLGVMSGTGIAGLTLGGGLGWLAARHGLACDNLVEAQVVTAAGTVVRAADDENPDLLWGLRGGGGNLGVVTRFRYRLHPVATVVAGAFGFAWSQARDVMRRYQELFDSAPDELGSVASFGLGPDGGPAVTILVCWSGDPAAADAAFAPIRAAGPAAVEVGEMPFVDWQQAPDPGYPLGQRHYWKSGYLPRLTDGAVDTLLDLVPGLPTPTSGIGLQALRGAAARVAPDATAFPHRSPRHDLLVLAQWPDPADDERVVAWARSAHDALRPHLDDGVYVNNLGVEGPARVRAAFGANHDRLVALKRRFDPDNVFRLNQNVAP